MPFHRPIPNQPKPARSPSSVASLVQAEKLMQIAVLLPASACIGWLIGAWADKHLHQSWIGLAGILVGGILGLIYVIRLVMTNPGTNQGITTSGSEDKNGEEESKTDK